MSLEEHLKLDPRIRDWVVLPMVLMMVLNGLLRSYVQQLLKSDKQMDKEDVKNKQLIMRASRLRTNGVWLNRQAFAVRKAHFVTPETGLLHAKFKGAPNPMSNPMGMVDMMKGNMTFLVSNVAMMTFISFFFSGFVLVKIPFPLTNRFKLMLQRGIDLSTLDVSYVSSLSWYFLVMFGIRGLLTLFMGDDTMIQDEAKAMQMQMGMGMGMGEGPMGFDASKAATQERESLEMVRHQYALDDVETRLLGPRHLAAMHQKAMKNKR